MRNLYQSPNTPHLANSSTNLGAGGNGVLINQQVQFVESHQHQTPTNTLHHHHHHHHHHHGQQNNSPKLVQLAQFNSPTYLKQHQTINSNKSKTILVANSPRTEDNTSTPQLNDDMNRPGTAKQHKLSSISSISSNSSISFLNSSSSNHSSDLQTNQNYASSNLDYENSMVMNESTASSDHIHPSDYTLMIMNSPKKCPTHQSRPGPHPMTKTTSHDPEKKLVLLSSSKPALVAGAAASTETDRFFDSTTLYRRELKQKQRDLLSTSYSINTPTGSASSKLNESGSSAMNVNSADTTPVAHYVNNKSFGSSYQDTSDLIKGSSSGHLNQSNSFSSTATSGYYTPTSSNLVNKNPHVQLQLQKLQQSIMKQEIEQQANKIANSSQSPMSLSQAGNYYQNHSDNSLMILEQQEQRESTQNSEHSRHCTLPANVAAPSHLSKSSSGSNKKVLNIFSNFLSRNKSNNASFSTDSPSSEFLTKNLKRTTSSSKANSGVNSSMTSSSSVSNFHKSKSSPKSNNNSILNTSQASADLPNSPSLTNIHASSSKPSILSSFNILSHFGSGHHHGSSRKYNINETVESGNITKSSKSKYRRSFDDLVVLQPTKLNDSLQKNSSRIEEVEDDENNDTKLANASSNAVFSTKNNGLIFLPSPPKAQQQKSSSPSPSSSPASSRVVRNEPVVESNSYYRTRPENIYENLDQMKLNLSQLDNNETRPSAVGSNCFDNVVYSYVDNKKQSSPTASQPVTNYANSPNSTIIYEQPVVESSQTRTVKSSVKQYAKQGSFASPSSSFSSNLSSSTTSPMCSYNQLDRCHVDSADSMARNNSTTPSKASSTSNHRPVVMKTSSSNVVKGRSQSINSHLNSANLSMMPLDHNSPSNGPVSAAVGIALAGSLNNLSSPNMDNIAQTVAAQGNGVQATSSSSQININQPNKINLPLSSTVMTLRDKFEQKSKTPQSGRVVMKKSHEILVNSSNSHLDMAVQQHSPALSSISATSSSVSFDSSSSGSKKDQPSVKEDDEEEEEESHLPQIVLAEQKNQTMTDESETNENEIDFNMLNYMYRKLDMVDEKILYPQNKFYSSYKQVFGEFVGKNQSQSSSIRWSKFRLAFVEFILDPCICEQSLNMSQNNQCQSRFMETPVSPSLPNLKFTIDFFKSMMLSTGHSSPSGSSNHSRWKAAATSIFRRITHSQQETDFIADFEDRFDQVKQFGVNDCTEWSNLDSIYQLFKNQIKQSDQSEANSERDSIKDKLESLVYFKLGYMTHQLDTLSKTIETNNQIGFKILKQLEDNLNVTLLELDKYKLLVNESDVITNLLLKLCNKLAVLDNAIQLHQMKSQIDESKTSNEEIELLKQELAQTQRKKEEAMFLKNGIDKRASIVSEFLLNYLDRDEHAEFEHFLQMKLVHSLSVRHLKDHIELTHLQLKILNEL